MNVVGISIVPSLLSLFVGSIGGVSVLGVGDYGSSKFKIGNKVKV